MGRRFVNRPYSGDVRLGVGTALVAARKMRENGLQGEADALPCTNSPCLSLESMSDSAGRAKALPYGEGRMRGGHSRSRCTPSVSFADSAPGEGAKSDTSSVIRLAGDGGCHLLLKEKARAGG